jgi:hypothetical protein
MYVDFRFLLIAIAAAIALPASASFHLWQMDELYSNADGSVQYLELTAFGPAEQFIRSHTLRSTNAGGSASNSFTFPADLPGSSGGRRFLVGTAGFAALNVVQPDFIVPNGFFFAQGGTLDYAESSDIWTHGALPTDPNLALHRDGGAALNSPQNFAGQTGRIIVSGTPPASLNFQGLWWRAPAGSEEGWGVNLAHQGDTLFATWFTYDTDGSALWLVMSNGSKVGTNAYSGDLYRTTGAPFNAYDSSRFQFTKVGIASFSFTDADNGSFVYTVGSLTQSKPITRQVFSSPVPTCSAGTAANASNFQDLWWASPPGSEDGWGINITHQGNTLFATWFTYGADGRGQWLVMSNGARVSDPEEGYGYGVPNYSGFKYLGDLYQTSGAPFGAYDATRFGFSKVGRAMFEFTGATGEFSYTVNGVTQTKTIARQVFSSPITVCR